MQFHKILERMRSVCMDYARAAGEDDEEYKKYSPYVLENRGRFDTMAIEFDINEPLPPIQSAERRPTTSSALTWLGIQRRDSIEGWKWALFEKRKFESVLLKFRKYNHKLKDILPLVAAYHSQNQSRDSLPSTVFLKQDESARRLGIAPHNRLRELSAHPEKDKTDYTHALEGFVIDAPAKASSIVVGSLFRAGHLSKGEKVLIEYKTYLTQDSVQGQALAPQHEADHQLASLLASSGNNDLCTLPFRGIIEELEHERRAFIFDVPKGSDPETPPLSLHSMIVGNDQATRLDLLQRFEIAQDIAKSINAFHSDGWVHKNIRSECVVFFRENTTPKPILKSPYLVNFGSSRPATAGSKMESDNDLERNLYRHPKRQRMPSSKFYNQHDLYALGIVLLEIGLWETAASIYKRTKLNHNGAVPSPETIQKAFVKVAERRLAHLMGSAYAEAVLACINGQFEDLASKKYFPIIFHEEVTQKLALK